MRQPVGQAALPPASWQALPGRELVSSSLELVDAQSGRMPFSLNVRRTLVAFFALMLAFAMLVLLWQLPERHLRKALVGVALAGGFVVLLGAQQLALCIWLLAGISRRGIIVTPGESVVVLGGLGGLALPNERVGASLSRFDDPQDARLAIWTNGLGAAGRYCPLGAGVGEFDKVFQISETLETLSPGRAGRAHNDYFEAVIESGIVGIALVLGWLTLLGLVCFKGLRMDGPALAWVGTFALLALQSILDYLLRNQTLLCFARLLLPARTLSENSVQGGRRSS